MNNNKVYHKVLTSSAVLLFLLPQASFAMTKVSSREYKIMLDASLFRDSPATAVGKYWSALQEVIGDSIDRTTSGDLGDVVKNRTVKFYDTPGTCVLYNNNYIFRERIKDDDREVTLKFRSADRYISAYKDMEGSDSDAETKFEEDISPDPFSSKFSHSTTESISSSKKLNYMNDPIELYPGLEDMGFDADSSISLVNNLEIAETVYKGADVDLGNLDADFSLTLWYNTTDQETPVIAEISFKYKDSDEEYSEKVVTRAYELYEAMQEMSDWVDSSSSTKTSYVYNWGTFCD